jgi:exodeoxyribonuclease VII small subunit
MAEASSSTEVTYEAGYEELKSIVTRLDAEDVSVHEMCELFARGKGLEKSLRSYLTDQQGKLDEIEAGENLPEFAIVAPSMPEGRSAPAGDRKPEPIEVDSSDFEPAPVAAAVDRDIPF